MKYYYSDKQNKQINKTLARLESADVGAVAALFAEADWHNSLFNHPDTWLYIKRAFLEDKISENQYVSAMQRWALIEDVQSFNPNIKTTDVEYLNKKAILSDDFLPTIGQFFPRTSLDLADALRNMQLDDKDYFGFYYAATKPGCVPTQDWRDFYSIQDVNYFYKKIEKIDVILYREMLQAFDGHTNNQVAFEDKNSLTYLKVAYDEGAISEFTYVKNMCRWFLCQVKDEHVQAISSELLDHYVDAIKKEDWLHPVFNMESAHAYCLRAFEKGVIAVGERNICLFRMALAHEYNLAHADHEISVTNIDVSDAMRRLCFLNQIIASRPYYSRKKLTQFATLNSFFHIINEALALEESMVVLPVYKNRQRHYFIPSYALYCELIKIHIQFLEKNKIPCSDVSFSPSEGALTADDVHALHLQGLHPFPVLTPESYAVKADGHYSGLSGFIGHDVYHLNKLIHRSEQKKEAQFYSQFISLYKKKTGVESLSDKNENTPGYKGLLKFLHKLIDMEYGSSTSGQVEKFPSLQRAFKESVQLLQVEGVYQACIKIMTHERQSTSQPSQQGVFAIKPVTDITNHEVFTK